ncbi:uncharacterized protein LOC141849686 [Brevipalpus obovatus]|uniref:uncharacterized protein LOC141849686 n=1 Tax=Brevipalpus obovatus TaxID=246614 RepID=UPI003D9F0774
MIKSIVLLASLLAVVAAHPQGLWGMSEDDPLLLKLVAEAFRQYSIDGRNNQELVKFSDARSTHLKDHVQFVLDVKSQHCDECLCSEYTMIVHVTCKSFQSSPTGYLFTFSDGTTKNYRHFNKCVAPEYTN